ncbi:MAG: hypothetical protein AB7O62_19485 [Pirellulales bacterium]
MLQLPRVLPGQPITAAAFNALVEAVNRLSAIGGSYPIEVRRHPAGVQISLAVQDREALVELTSSLSGGGSATAKILHFDGSTWIDAQTDPIRVHDVIGSMEGNVSDHALCRFHRQSGRWLVWQLEC